MGVKDKPAKSNAFGFAVLSGMILLVLAVLFASSYSAGLVAANARSLHSTNALLGSSAVLRAANNQAALFTRDAELGTAEEAAKDIAIDEAERTLEMFEEVANALDPSLVARHTRIRDQLATLATASSQAMESARGGDYETTFQILQDSFEPTWESARDDLRATQSQSLMAIEDSESLAGWIAGGTRFLAILVLPALALFIYRRIVKEQVVARRREFEAKLDYERRLNTSKDELIAGVSHQLRTPLTSIYGMSDVLTDGKRVDRETAQEFMGVIRNEAYELDRMVSDLLATARLDAKQVSFRTDAFEVASTVDRAVGPAEKSGQQIDVDADRSLRAIGDPDRVVHILRNLLSNSHKHGGPHTWVTVRDVVGHIEIEVADSSSKELDEADLFSSFANGGAGALTNGSVGLGLSVAKRLAEGMGGTLTYRAAEGVNRFILRLESVYQPSPDRASAAKEATPVS